MFSIAGDLDAASAPRLRQAFADLDVTPGSVLTIDLGDVPFVDSAGLAALVAGIRRVRACGGDAVVCCVRPPVRRVLAISGLDSVVTVVDGRPALAAE